MTGFLRPPREKRLWGHTKRETHEETPVVLQAREGGAWLRGDGGGGGTWSDSRCVVHVKLTAAAEGLVVGNEPEVRAGGGRQSQDGLLPVWHCSPVQRGSSWSVALPPRQGALLSNPVSLGRQLGL